MAAKLIVLCLVLSAFQFTNALEKRSIISDIQNNTINNLQNLVKGVITPIEKGIEDGIANVGNLIKNATAKVEQAVSNVIETATNLSNAFVTRIQTEVQKAVQLGKNLSFGIPGQVINCFSSGLFGVLGCEGQLAANLTSRAGMLAAAGASDALKLGSMAISIPIGIGQCEAGGLSYATTQFSALTISTLNCIKNGSSA
ncbi:hypothetical protein C0J52_21573 [Blattella germanica]|nr:hypothetical protein C0J52_21573 [Blattella germanica]